MANMKTIKYGAVRNDGNYGNDRLEAEVELEEGDNPEEVEERLRQWVLFRLEKRSMLLTRDIHQASCHRAEAAGLDSRIERLEKGRVFNPSQDGDE